MKNLFLTIFVVLFVFKCFGQRYEIWVKTSNSAMVTKGIYGFSNDSVLMTFTNPSLIIPAKNQYFKWDDVTNLKIRNKSKNLSGQLIGAGAGFLATAMMYNSMKKSWGDQGPAGLMLIVTMPFCVGGGYLIGHLATSKKTELPMYGKDSRNKNKLMESKVKKRNKQSNVSEKENDSN